MDFTALITALTAKGYHVHEFATKEEAAAYMDARIDSRTVGIGGSESVREMGLYPLLKRHNTVTWHNHPEDDRPVPVLRHEAMRAQVYISSVNAIAETGELVNIDGTGNRLAATTYGPDTVWFVIGENKIAPDLNAAVFRARNVAAPKNAQRLHRKTPCAVKGDRCYDCDSPERICRALSVFWTKPNGINYEIALVHEALGY